MVQSFNLAAILSIWKIVRNPHLVIPHIRVSTVNEIDFARLKEKGFNAVVFDKDNTLTLPYAPSVHPPLQEAVRRCVETFGIDKVCVFSNSLGSSDDCGDSPHALDLPVIRHRLKKPDGMQNVLRFFGALTAERLVVVGDRLLTDISFGNFNGALTILTRPLSRTADPFVVRLLRPFEDWLLARCTPSSSAPYHPLLDTI